ncbi:MAG TPA: M23 family metallopeptidase [Geothermobacteraceae bacterium]|nr:M23 family metallopeptidase [Geothermobacteraceae bacterium]
MLRTSTVVLLFVLLIALIAGGVYYFRDTEGPQVVINPDSGPVSANRPLQLKLTDQDSGLRNASVSVVQNGKTFPLLNSEFPIQTQTESLPLSLADLKLKSGPLELVVQATDRSVYHFGKGNTSEQRVMLEYDNKPPVISVRSRSHNLRQGGSGLIIYTVSEEVVRTGVVLGERFFPGYQQPSGDYACLFSLGYDTDAKGVSPRLIAEDLAGNERQTGFNYFANPRKPVHTRINLSDSFLDAKMPNFQHLYPEETDLLGVFLKVNQQLRTANRQQLGSLGKKTASEPLWNGSFFRQPGANKEGFGAVRTYYYRGKKVDIQTHLGIDLASVAHGPINATNDGVVVYADEFGIYGQCVIIDHGLGLQSIYGHLSSIGVAVGDQVHGGDEIGRTGATGLAGGDHLHFGILVAGTPVNPLEWWDPNWVKNNITSKLQLLKER